MTKLERAWKRFWFTAAPTLPLDVIRVGVGLLAATSALLLWPDLEPFFAASWLHTSGARILTASLFLSGSAGALGLGGRSAFVLMFLCLGLLALINPFIFNSGDTLLRHLMFVAALAPAGNALFMSSRSGPRSSLQRAMWPLRLIQIQVALMYLAAVVHKLAGRSWRAGVATSLVLRVPDVTRFTLPAALLESTTFAHVTTWATLVIEAAFPVLVWNRAARPWILGLGIALHVSFDFALRPGLFSAVVLLAYVAFVPAATLEAVFRRVHVRREVLGTMLILGAMLRLGLPLGHVHEAGPGATPEEFLAWLKRRPSEVGLVILSNAQSTLLAHHGDDIFPLASLRKVLIVGAYADAVAEHALDPGERVPLLAAERWYWPGADGGAHASAIGDLSRRGRIEGTRGAASATLDDLAFCAVRWSDNSAADYLLERVGLERITRFAAQHGLSRQERIAPILGEQLAWTQTKPAAWRALSSQERFEKAMLAARQLTGARAAAERRLPDAATQRALADISFGGTAREWARLFATIFAPSQNGSAATILRRHLEWPLIVFPNNARRFVHLAGKAGAIGGVRTQGVFIEPAGQPAIAAALFLRGIDAAAQEALTHSNVDQEFLIRVAEDRSFRDVVRRSF